MLGTTKVAERPRPAAGTGRPTGGRVLGPALAGCLGTFSLVNLLGEAVAPGFDASLWWIDLRALPAPIGRAVLLAASVLFVGYGLRPVMAPWRRKATRAMAAALLVACAWNAATFYRPLARPITAGRQTQSWSSGPACIPTDDAPTH
jgi:hypothetical protein